jgi:hypothetical protein
MKEVQLVHRERKRGRNGVVEKTGCSPRRAEVGRVKNFLTFGGVSFDLITTCVTCSR